MNATFTERQAQREYIDYIKQEIARLNGEYKLALDRIRQLDEIEAKSAVSAAVVTLEPNEDNTSATMTIEEAIEKHNSNHFEVPAQVPQIVTNEFTVGVNGEPATSRSQFIQQIEELKDKDDRKNPMRASGRRDVKKIASEAVAILKDAGVPMKTKKLMEILKDKGYNTSSPYVLMNQMKSHEPKIQQAKHGYYQYKW
jgi:hypothetical protein